MPVPQEFYKIFYTSFNCKLLYNFHNINVVKLKYSENSYRIKVGSYRVLYDIFDDILLVSVTRIGHRKDVYRDKS